jgi:phospholipase/lecithinase/hemolysin
MTMVNQFWGEWAQRGLRVLAACALVLLAACGSSSKYDEFIPTRIVSIGDQLSYIGTNGYDRFTVNNVSGETSEINNWVIQLATGYGLIDSQAISSGATNNQALNLVSNLANQLSGKTAQSGDMLVVNAGMADIIYWTDQVRGGTKTTTEALTAISNAGTAYQAFAIEQQINFKHILILNAYDLKDSPYATANIANANFSGYVSTFNSGLAGIRGFLHDMTRTFNTALIRNAGTFSAGSGVRLFDVETVFLNANLYGIGIIDLTNRACPTSSAAGCKHGGTTGTSTSDLNPYYNMLLFADEAFPTPLAHRLLGNQVYGFLRGGKGW